MRAHRPAGNVGPVEKRAVPPRQLAVPSPAGVLAGQRTAGNAAVTRYVQQVLASPGRPLTEPLRSEMEARLGADFSGVRLHTGADARRSAAGLGARAYTSGSHVVLGDGGADRHTLAHELTHVVQQRRGPVAGTDDGTGLRVSDPADHHERAAEENAVRAMKGPAPGPAGAPAGQARRGPLAVQRVIHQEPSYVASVGGRTSLTNRGDLDTEERGGETYVRVYQTVFAPVAAGGGHKDVQQHGGGSIDFLNQQDSAWLNMGRPWRAMHYMRTYQDQKNRKAPGGFASPTARTTALVRSFLIPLDTYRRVTGSAVSEQQINSTRDPGNVSQSTDKAKDSDQYQIRGKLMGDVAATAVPGSLVTYAPDGLVTELGKEPRHGTVKPLSELLGRLSMPDLQDFPEYRPSGGAASRGLVLSLDQGRMPAPRAQERLVERLAGLVDEAFPENGRIDAVAKGARAELKRRAGLWGVNDRDIDWEAVRNRVERAMNYAGMPAVLAEVFKVAETKASGPGGGGFPVRNFPTR